MPFDQQNFVTTETNPHDVFSLEGLIWWLERQRPEIAYCYVDNGQCLLARYFQQNGYPIAEVAPGVLLVNGHANGPTILFPGVKNWGDHNVLDNVAQGRPRTFGAALDRARKILAEQS